MGLPKLRLGLRFKMAAYISLLVILTAAVLGWFLVQREVEGLDRHLEEKGKLLARSVANASEYGVITGDREMFRNIIEGLTQETDVAYCIIYDIEGKILAGTPARPNLIDGISQTAALTVRANALSTKDLLIQSFTKDKTRTPVYDIAVPIMIRREPERAGEELMFEMVEDVSEEVKIEKIGVARIGVSLDKMNEAIAESRRTILEVTALVVSLAIVATVFLVRRVVDPVRQLVAATERVAAGDLDRPVAIETNDEIGELGASFNKMTEDLKRYRTEIEQHSRTLEQKVEERTGALRLMNEEMHETNRELEKVSRHKSEFLANMSHELRTPLNAIIGFSEILYDQSFGELNEKQLSYAQNVVTSGKHLLQLINEILDLAKVESGKMILHLESFPVAGAITEIAALAGGLASEKEVTVRRRLSPDLTTITADRKKFKQIFYNLLSNAIKFTPDGGWVEISSAVVGDFEHTDDDRFVGRRNARFCVSDNGIGIDEEDQESIFQEFQQLDASYSREYEGTGLGLALTKKLIELHGGSIWLESEKGKGSSFYFTIPLTEQDAAEPPEEPVDRRPAESEAASVPGDEGGKGVVLVVEDDQRSFELIATYLEEAGYEVIHAATGEQALRAAHANRPTIIALDIILPDMDGWSVLQRLKASDETSHIPVVITSVVQDEDTAFSLGASDYIVKPVSRRELIGCVERLREIAEKARISNILIVDDDRSFVDALTSTLEGESFSVARAYTGLQGIELASRQRPDLIFIDLILPDMSGFDVIEFLKMSESTKEIPIIIITDKDLTPEEKDQLNGKIEAAAGKGRDGKHDFLSEIRRVERLVTAKKGGTLR